MLASSSARRRLSLGVHGFHGANRTAQRCGKPTSRVRSCPDAGAASAAQSRVDRKEHSCSRQSSGRPTAPRPRRRRFPYALGLAEPDKAKLVVAHVREIFVGRGGGYPVLADETELRDTIHHQVEELRSSGLDATFVVRTCTAGHAAAHDRRDRRARSTQT